MVPLSPATASKGSPCEEPEVNAHERTGRLAPSWPKSITVLSCSTLWITHRPSARPTATVSNAGLFARHVTATRSGFRKLSAWKT